jgi:hypothetical protein
MRSKGLCLIVGSLALWALSGTAIAATPVKIIDTKANELDPSVSDGLVVWTANTLAHQNSYRAYMRVPGGATTKIPVAGQTQTGNIVVDGIHAGHIVVMTDAGAGGDWNIRIYDPESGHVTNLPASVNTAKDETGATVSGDYLAFNRNVNGNLNLLLYRFSTDHLSTIVKGWAYGPEVAGDYIAYNVCTGSTAASCKAVYRYQISTSAFKKMPAAPSGRANYWGAVTSDGTMYYVQGSADRCGRHVHILRWQSGVTATIWSAPRGIETWNLNVNPVGAKTVVAFTRFNCTSLNYGAYRLSL